MNISGWAAKSVASVVVPDRAAPMIRKSGYRLVDLPVASGLTSRLGQSPFVCLEVEFMVESLTQITQRSGRTVCQLTASIVARKCACSFRAAVRST